MPNNKTKLPDPFTGFKNLGPATRKDLELLNIRSVGDLAKADPDELYIRLQIETGSKNDPCCWDVFAAAIHQAKTGEGLSWWAFTAERKDREKAGGFPRSPLPD